MRRLFDEHRINKYKSKKPGEDKVFDLDYDKKSVHNVSEWWAPITILIILLLGYITERQLYSLPNALTAADEESNFGSFISERAWNDLRILNNFGPRPVGSYENDVLAVDFLKREISYIQQLANKNQRIYADVQLATGSFWADSKWYGMTTVYRNIPNVIVKLMGREPDDNAILLNCHFDSVHGSPGASDDAANCCVMLEILRVLSKQNEVHRHSIVFLFNGAEEIVLQGAHGFITQHKWAKTVKAFLNLESAGSNGKEMLFQSSANHGWLIEKYQAVPHPHGQVVAEDIYESGLIPSITDYSIFQKFGNLPGMDFAHTMNGYRYHTKYDSIDYLSMECLQRTGDNILKLVRVIIDSDEVKDPEKYATGSRIYFDVLGLVFVSYSREFGFFWNVFVCVVSLLIPVHFLSYATKGIHSWRIIKELLFGFLINLLSIGFGLSASILIANELDWSDNSMSWYHHTSIAIPLYSIPIIFIQSMGHCLLERYRKTPLSLGLRVQARLIGTNLFWVAITLGVTFTGFRAGYIFMIPLLLSAISNGIIGLLGLQNSIKTWLYVHCFVHSLTVLWATNFYHVTMAVFIATSGRSGGDKNPDVIVGILGCTLTFFITSFWTPLVALLNRKKNYFVALIAIFIVTRVYFIQISHIGFPYRGDKSSNPTPQRHQITHTIRTLYDINGKERYTDSGYWMRDLDRNAEKTIESLSAPDNPVRAENNPLCGKELFCGVPYYTSGQFRNNWFWLPGPPPFIREQVKIKLTERYQNDRTVHLNFTVTGNYLFAIELGMKNDVELVGWDITDTVPKPNSLYDREGYFIEVTNGLNALPMNFTLQLKTVRTDYDGPLLDVSIVTYHREYHKEHTSAFAQLLAKVPNWAFAVPAVASLQSWIF